MCWRVNEKYDLCHREASIQFLNLYVKIRQSTIYYPGLLGRWDKRIFDQESDVPSIIFFILFCRLRALKTFYFYFCNFIKKNKKINLKNFWKEFCKKSWKKIVLGTSDAWSKIRLSHRPSEPVYYIVNWRIFKSWHQHKTLTIWWVIGFYKLFQELFITGIFWKYSDRNWFSLCTVCRLGIRDFF